MAWDGWQENSANAGNSVNNGNGNKAGDSLHAVTGDRSSMDENHVHKFADGDISVKVNGHNAGGSNELRSAITSVAGYVANSDVSVGTEVSPLSGL